MKFVIELDKVYFLYIIWIIHFKFNFEFKEEMGNKKKVILKF
jgi:hypothetical protein